MHKYLFIGRFQPFHNAHFKIVEKLADKGVIVGIGSAQESHTSQNPFTAGERHEMIRAALDELQISATNGTSPGVYDRIPIIPIPDVKRYGIWVSHVEDLCPKFDTVVTGNPVNTMLFKEAGYTVVNTTRILRGTGLEHISGTRTRISIHDKSDEWKCCVPHAVHRYITKIGGDKRIQTIGIEKSTEVP
jgi:nicotinamide-nucleotide adenylyltransferase